MARPQIVEVDYFEFLEALKIAADQGRRINAADKTRWKAYIQEHKVKEASTMVFAKAKAETVKSVIIDGGEWDGFYAYAPDDSLCLKFIPGS